MSGHIGDETYKQTDGDHENRPAMVANVLNTVASASTFVKEDFGNLLLKVFAKARASRWGTQTRSAGEGISCTLFALARIHER